MKFFNDHREPEDETAGPVTEVALGPVPLSSIRSGQTVRVESLPVCAQAASRLYALGLTPGTEFKVIQNLFGPILLSVRGSRISLGHGLAGRLLVSPGRNGVGRKERNHG
jgi:ferrous iron transport protein A